MTIIGCDFHTRYQQIAMADDETGELILERRLDHGKPGDETGGQTGSFPFITHPQEPFNRPNSRSTLIFGHSL
jgi:hypothetical protein